MRFGDKSGLSKVNPQKFTKALNKAVGMIHFAKVLQDRNLLVGCSKEKQVTKPLNLKELAS